MYRLAVGEDWGLAPSEGKDIVVGRIRRQGGALTDRKERMIFFMGAWERNEVEEPGIYERLSLTEDSVI